MNFDRPRVLVAAHTATASGAIVQALRDAGYDASATLTGSELVRDLRNQRALELLVLDGSERPWIVGATIDAVRAMNWVLPIILIARPDQELRAEAERLGIEAILETPVTAQEVRRVAMQIVPVVPSAELDLAG